MSKTLAVFALVLFAVLFLTPNAHAQAPICDVTCTPDPGGSTYAGAVAARPKLLNARGFSSPIQVTAGPQQVPMVAGSQSYNYVIPILSLPGRAGMDLNLNLYYNSRVWDIDTINGTATFNADRDFPSYGFRLDFGYLEYDVINDQYIVTERDGTKHALPNSGSYNSTDGTYINYNSTSKVLTYKNGTTVLYAPFPTTANLFRPTQIKDTNGNFISIAYVSVAGQEQSIQSITDTLGRVINFRYTSNKLTSIDQLNWGQHSHLRHFHLGDKIRHRSLLSSVQLEDSSSHVLRTVSYAWIQSGGANVLGTITTTLNDTGQQSSVQYSAYDAYGNAGDIKELDFGGQVPLRHTVTTYTPLVPQHILNLPTLVLVKDTSDNIISRTGLTYDDPGSVTINITDAASHDNTPLTVHGNLTSISRYSDPSPPEGRSRGTSITIPRATSAPRNWIAVTRKYLISASPNNTRIRSRSCVVPE